MDFMLGTFQQFVLTLEPTILVRMSAVALLESELCHVTSCHVTLPRTVYSKLEPVGQIYYVLNSLRHLLI